MNMFRYSFMLMVFLLASVSSQAQPDSPPPAAKHTMPGMENAGSIEGFVFEQDANGQKKPVAGQEVVMMVFQNSKQVLMLNKNTDDNGLFVFKNIFHDAAYSYGFGTVFQEKLYVLPRLQLTQDKEAKKVDFRVGEGSPLFRDPATMGMGAGGAKSDEAPAMGSPSAAASQHGNDHNQNWNQPFQKLALIFCVVVALLGAYYLGKKSK